MPFVGMEIGLLGQDGGSGSDAGLPGGELHTPHQQWVPEGKLSELQRAQSVELPKAETGFDPGFYVGGKYVPRDDVLSTAGTLDLHGGTVSCHLWTGTGTTCMQVEEAVGDSDSQGELAWFRGPEGVCG